ncbi:glycosyltransferase family 4 protein [Flavobacterium ardleyense]|uniref:Glycosyltransferase family 4 protein n=1 Tax=Flavobacterium ardleyense TaxID=2038737 RepID=A0ABW5ZA56_9FLAO
MKIKILYLGNKLAKHGYNKTTIETLGPALEQEDYVVYYSSDKKMFFFRLMDMVKAVFLYRNKVDYVLIDTYSTKAFWYALFSSQVARLLKLKYIPILHGGNLPQRLKNNPYLSRLIFQNAYKNVAPSAYLQNAFEAFGYSNIVPIANAISIKEYAFLERISFEPKLLWVRAFAAIYNPKMAVDVLLSLKQKYPNASLTMVGPEKDGSLQTTKEYAQSKGVTINFTGQLPKEAWLKLATEHNIFINTTHFDNAPVSVMEAMALGVPVVSTNVGGIPYLIQDELDGFLVGDNQATEMVDKIIKLITNPTANRVMVKKARKKMELLDWKIIKHQWRNLLK